MMGVGRRSQMIDDKGKVKSLSLSFPRMTGSITGFFLVFFSIVLTLSIPCTANAEIDDNLKGVPPSNVSEWNYYGFSSEESEKWINKGIIFAGWAAQWRDEGFSPEAAGKWRKIANVYTAGDFLINGFNAAEAKKWIDNGIRSGLRAREYLSVGLSAEEAVSYWSNSIYPDELKEWKSAGFKAEELLQWHYGPRESTFFFTKDSPYGRSLYELKAAVQWRDAGFTSNEMQASGKYRFELAEARQWKAAGFKFDEAVQWRDLDFTLNDALSYKNAGLKPVAAEGQRYDASDDKPDEITRLEVDITLNRDGSLDVIEKASIIDRPGGMYERGYFKTLPKKARLKSSRSHGYTRVDYSGTVLNVKSVEIDDKAADYYISDNVLHFGSKVKPLTEGEHIIKLVYSTDSRVLYEPHHDELCFGIIDYNPKGVYIKNASATIRLPKGTHVIFTDGNAGFDGREHFTSRVEETGAGDVVYFTLTSPLKTGMYFTVNVGFVKGYVIESRMHKFDKFDRETGRLLTSFLSFVMAFVVLFLYYFIAWFKVGRDPKKAGPVTTDFLPPGKMDPAMMRAIHTKGEVDHLSVSAEILYLAERGLINVSVSSETFKIKKIPVESVELPPTAKRFYDNLWAGIQTELSLTSGRKNDVLSIAAHALKTSLKNEINKHVVSNSRYLWPGIIFAVLAIIFSLTIIDYHEHDYGKAKIFIFVYAGFMITAFAILSFIFMRLLRSVTENHAKLAHRVQSYVGYVTLSYADISAFGFVPSFLREHLPYAIAASLDIHDATIHKGDAKWYRGTGEGFKCGHFIKTVKKSI